MDTAQCEICGLDAPVASLYLGWGGYVCTDNPECRPPMGPRQRKVALMPAGLLDDLEWVADEAEKTCQDADVQPAVLRALIDAARRDMQRVTSTPSIRIVPDPSVPVGEAHLVAGDGTRIIARTWGAGPGTTPLSESEDDDAKKRRP